MAIYTPENLGVMASSHKKEPRGNFFDAPAILTVSGEPKWLFIRCGHYGVEVSKIDFYGKGINFIVKKEFQEKIDGIMIIDALCPQCTFEYLKKYSIRCGLCGCSILPGEGVALYHKESEGINTSVATFVGESVIGCLSWNCCPSGGFFAGYWTEKGFKSPLESVRDALIQYND